MASRQGSVQDPVSEDWVQPEESDPWASEAPDEPTPEAPRAASPPR